MEMDEVLFLFYISSPFNYMWNNKDIFTWQYFSYYWRIKYYKYGGGIIMVEKLKTNMYFWCRWTLSEYRYKDILYGGGCPELGCQSLEDLLFNDLFFTARPLKTMQKVIEKLDSDKIFCTWNSYYK